METNSLLIGITGGFGSGKSTASSLFELKGFMKITLSSFLEEEAKKRSFKKITREILQDIGNEWRKNFGHGILAGKAVDYIKRDPSAGSGQAKIKKAVIDGIRNTGEVERLRKEKNFILLGFVADKKIRFERLKNIKRREKVTWEIFRKLDRRDMGLGQKHTGLQVLACQKKADIVIRNDRSIKEFENQLEKFLNSYEKKVHNSN